MITRLATRVRIANGNLFLSNHFFSIDNVAGSVNEKLFNPIYKMRRLSSFVQTKYPLVFQVLSNLYDKVYLIKRYYHRCTPAYPCGYQARQIKS